MAENKNKAELEAAAAAEAAELARMQAEEDAAKAATATESEAKERQVTKIAVRAVAGTYYDHSTATRFPQYEEVEAELNTWLQIQLDAGYIEKA